jgi:hypothetical protein
LHSNFVNSTKKQFSFKKNAEFDADFESVGKLEKMQQKICEKSYQQKVKESWIFLLLLP